MSNKELLTEVKSSACSCDPMNGWTCSFCKDTLPKLKSALGLGYHKRRSPYEPRKLPREVHVSSDRRNTGLYNSRKLPGLRYTND